MYLVLRNLLHLMSIVPIFWTILISVHASINDQLIHHIDTSCSYACKVGGFPTLENFFVRKKTPETTTMK